MIFYNFCYYFWGQHRWWTETNIIGNAFLFFTNFHCPKRFYCFPCPTAAPASLNMHVASTNFAKTLVANLNMTSYCDVTNSVYPVTMTTICHCSILEFVKGASNQAVAPGITTPLHATGMKSQLLRVKGKFSVDIKMSNFVGNVLQNKFYACCYILLSGTNHKRRCTPICGA